MGRPGPLPTSARTGSIPPSSSAAAAWRRCSRTSPRSCPCGAGRPPPASPSRPRPGPADEVPVYSEDAATILVRFADGARGAATISQISPGRKNALTLEIDGSRGALAWAQETPETHLDRQSPAGGLKVAAPDSGPGADDGGAVPARRAPGGLGRRVEGPAAALLPAHRGGAAPPARARIPAIPRFASGPGPCASWRPCSPARAPAPGSASPLFSRLFC